ncbi:hypothetical protein B9Z65_7301 [Elsinoe australis]|uniref:Uncharacterized protein n=1 Tax=Elsinoe australis TaxID=40998 RepID=A0A2P7Z6D4_9PEZI|nr:hypothetical protein B9Z65_7301 [Elsinoe australis]
MPLLLPFLSLFALVASVNLNPSRNACRKIQKSIDLVTENALSEVPFCKYYLTLANDNYYKYYYNVDYNFTYHYNYDHFGAHDDVHYYDHNYDHHNYYFYYAHVDIDFTNHYNYDHDYP